MPPRFWSQVRKGDGCWEWAGALAGGGYGTILAHGRQTPAHRLSYEMEHGAIPDGMFVCHHCDNRKCVRPSHLYAGTHQNNLDDMVRRGRSKDPSTSPIWYAVRGEQQGMARLTEAAIRDIRSSPLSSSKLALKYGVSSTNVRSVRRGETWKHVS